MPRPPRVLVLLTIPALALSACGSGGSTSSPAKRLSAASAALKQAPGFHFEGTSTDKDGVSTLKGDSRANGDVDVKLTQAAGAAEIRVISKAVFINADSAFWTANADAATAAKLAGKWVTVPAGSFSNAELSEFTPGTLAACLTQPVGSVSDGGKGDVDGQAATIIKQADDKPGAAPQELFLAASGPAYPLRLVQTGPDKPGGKAKPPCQQAGDTTTASSVTISDFTASTPIAKPDAVDIQSLVAG